nr:DMT family transporter [uncultured Holophaga sp.]
MAGGSSRTYAVLMLVFVIWGSLYVASKYVLGQLPPLTVSCLRYLIASAVLLPMALRRPRSRMGRGDWLRLLFVGSFGYALSMGAQMLGTRYAGASLAALINALNPVAILLLAALTLGEPLGPRKLLGMGLALAGTYAVLGGSRDHGHLLGILLSLLSVGTWAFVSVAQRQLNQRHDPLRITSLAILAGLLCTLPFALGELHRAPRIHLNSGGVLALLYMGLACTALAHTLWNRALSQLEAGSCALFYPIQPLAAAALGALWLGERPGTAFGIGAALILGGLLVSLAPRRLRAPALKA